LLKQQLIRPIFGHSAVDVDFSDRLIEIQSNGGSENFYLPVRLFLLFEIRIVNSAASNL